MKRGLLITGIIISLSGAAQPTVKLYGYSQVITPGMVPQREIPNENGGRTIKTSPTNTHYYVYTRTSSLIKANEIWVGGKWYTANETAVLSTPVVIEEPEKKILVPFTKSKVLRIDIGDTARNGSSLTLALKKMMASNDLIVSYTWKRKKYYVALKKWVVLEPQHAQ